MTKKITLKNFEAALQELEQIVEKMESGEQSLEESLSTFQRGITLTKECQQNLKAAQQRVEKLIRENNTLKTEPLNPEDE